MIIALRSVDDITDVDVYAESLPIDRPDKSQVRVRPVRQAPAHHFNSELRPLWLDPIDHIAAVADCGLEEFGRKVAGIRPVPKLRVVRARDIDAASSPDNIGQRQALRNVLEILFPLVQVRVEHVVPGSDFRNHHVLGGKRFANDADPIGVPYPCFRAVRSTVAETPMLTGEFLWIIGFQEDGAPQTNRAGMGNHRRDDASQRRDE